MMPELQLRAMVSIVAPKFNLRLKTPLKFFRASSSSTSIEYPPPRNHPQWSGLHLWRRSPINDHRYWGPNGPIQEPRGTETDPHYFPAFSALDSCALLAEMDVVVLSTANPLTKAKLFHLAYAKWRKKGLPVGVSDAPLAPARPSPIKPPEMVSPKEIPPPKSSGLPLNGYMLHNLAHVELKAIDLAWDTVVRFSPFMEILGEGFFADFAHVADAESRHFTWCSQRLAELGFS